MAPGLDSTVTLLTRAYEVVPIDDLVVNPENVNVGDVEGIAESISTVGFFGAIIARRSDRLIAAGNHRWMAARERGLTEVGVLWIDEDDPELFARIALADNEWARRGANRPGPLAELLTWLAETERGLVGTAYTPESLDDLLLSLETDNLERVRRELGDHDPEEVWPRLHLVLEPSVLARFEAWWASHPGDTDTDKALWLLGDEG